jgi:hypothetical protein
LLFAMMAGIAGARTTINCQDGKGLSSRPHL